MKLSHCMLAALGFFLALSGCGLLSGEQPQLTDQTSSVSKQTLGDEYFEPLLLDHTPLEQPATETMRDAYKALLEIVGDPLIKKATR